MVVHEEHQLRSNSSGSGSRHPKKNKAKSKIPQRGLGVAQLEKLRIEEQQKNSSPSSSSVVPQPQHQQQLPVLPFLGAPRDPNSLLGSAFNSSASQNAEFFNPNLSYSVNGGFPTSNAESFKYVPTMVWGEKVNNLDASTIDASQSQYQHVSWIQLVNKAASVPFSSSDNLQMEPPSSQNYNSSYRVNSSQAEERRNPVQIAGTNQPWPFQPDHTASSMPLSYRVPQFNNFFFKPGEPVPIYGKLPVPFDQNSFAYSEEGSSSSNAYQAAPRNSELHPKKRCRENGASVDGEFHHPLTSRSKQSTAIPPSQPLHHHELPLLQSHERSENSSQRTFYNFLPMGTPGHEADATKQSNEAWDDIDTRLTL